jgi:glycosyltransferase involved in cell wall biosynthesis
MVIVEAQAMRRPLVAARHGGAVETVEHGVTGLLFEPGSASSLAEAIERLYRAPELAVSLGEQGRARAVAMFSIAEHVRGVQEIYEKVLSTRASRAGAHRASPTAGGNAG